MFTKKDIINLQTKGLKDGQGVIIEITDDMERVANVFVDSYIKAHEQQHKKDNRNLKVRLKHGILGEMAVCEALGFGWQQADISIGETKKYQVADLKHLGIAAGVKTCKLGNFPLLYIDSDEVEIICVIGEKGKIWVAGVATPSIIKNGCSDEYVKDKRILAKNRYITHHKSAFFDFENLISLELLKSGIKDYTLNSGIWNLASSVWGEPGGNTTPTRRMASDFSEVLE